MADVAPPAAGAPASLPLCAEGHKTPHHRYRAFGARTDINGIAPARQDPSFQNRTFDAGLGIYDYRNRSFDPATGRFLQRDPVMDDDNLYNPYAAMGNDPVGNTDPMGDDFGEIVQMDDGKKVAVWVIEAWVRIGSMPGDRVKRRAGSFPVGRVVPVKRAKDKRLHAVSVPGELTEALNDRPREEVRLFRRFGGAVLDKEDFLDAARSFWHNYYDISSLEQERQKDMIKSALALKRRMLGKEEDVLEDPHNPLVQGWHGLNVLEPQTITIDFGAREQSASAGMKAAYTGARVEPEFFGFHFRCERDLSKGNMYTEASVKLGCFGAQSPAYGSEDMDISGGLTYSHVHGRVGGGMKGWGVVSRAIFDVTEWKGNVCLRPGQRELRVEPRLKIGSHGYGLEVNPRELTLEVEKGLGEYGVGAKVRLRELSEEERRSTPSPEGKGGIAPSLGSIRG